METRALYNSLRLSWIHDPTLEVEEWQVEDYRILPVNIIFERLSNLGIQLDKTSFMAFAEAMDSPEELTDQLVGDWELSLEEEDQIYLLIFELWRRLKSDKPALSILCDEIDRYIALYDEGQEIDEDTLLYQINRLILILDEAKNELNPEEALEIVFNHFAHDFPLFLYDFCADQIEHGNVDYVQGLLADFSPYLPYNPWCRLLQGYLLSKTNSTGADEICERLLKELPYFKVVDGFALQLLGVIAATRNAALFKKGLKPAVEALESEGDFAYLLDLSLEYLQYYDLKREAAVVEEIRNKRLNTPFDQPFHHNKERDLQLFTALFNQGPHEKN